MFCLKIALVNYVLLFLICIPKERLPNGIFYIFSSIFPIIILALESQEEHCIFFFFFNFSAENRKGREVVSELSENRIIDNLVGPLGMGM